MDSLHSECPHIIGKIGEKYRCNVCGSEVTVMKVGGRELVCRG